MRVLVCGSRDLDDINLVNDTLSRLHAKHRFTCLIHGAASGADTIAKNWARYIAKIPDWPFPADWYPDGVLDRGAGPKRNALMLRQGRPHLVVAFPGERGTADMITQSLQAHVMVLRIPPSSRLDV